ncbi:MAG: sulfatase family protein [Planctomycetota bacterium]
MQKQTRREFLKSAGYATAALGDVCLQPEKLTAGSAAERPPNILFIMCDQLSANALSCYGGPVPTPNIDRMARDGVRFTDATCTTPYCSPTRASIITGMYPHAHGIVLNCNPNRQQGIGPTDLTTERLLHQAGYATHHYGKWHLEGNALPYYPDMFRSAVEYKEKMESIFAEVRRRDKATWMDWYAWALPVDVAPALRSQVEAIGDRWKDKRFAEFITTMGRLRLPPEQCFDVQVADLTCHRIKSLESSDQPFMITSSFIWPHDPNVVPSPYYEAFDPKDIELPGNMHVREALFEKDWSREIVRALGEPGLREFLRIYYGMVKLIDDQVGRILTALDQTGKTDDTVIVFTSDHGDMMGGHGMVWKSTRAFYEEVVRVPLLISCPKKFRSRVSHSAADSTDLMPTLLELAGRPVPRHVQGRSLVSHLTGSEGSAGARTYTFSERVAPNPQGRRKVLPGTKGDFMVRGEGWKYVRYRDGREYLYNLRDDPGEMANLAGDPKCRTRQRGLEAEMDKWLARTGWPNS